MADDVKRDSKGKVVGGALRTAGKVDKAVRLSRRTVQRLRELYGSEYILVDWKIEIASNPTHRDRLKAIVSLEERIYGKALQSIEVSGPGGAPVQSEVTTNAAPHDRIAALLKSAGILARAGVVPPAGRTDDSAGGAAGERSGGAGGAGEGEPPA